MTLYGIVLSSLAYEYHGGGMEVPGEHVRQVAPDREQDRERVDLTHVAQA